MEIREYQTAQSNEVKSDLIRLNMSATATDTIPMLVALFVATMFGTSLSLIVYGLVAVVSISFFDLWWRLRNAIREEINRVHGAKYGLTHAAIQENEELRQRLDRERTERELAGKALVHAEPKRVPPIEQTKNLFRYNPSVDDQVIISDALLIHQQWLLGSNSNTPTNLWSRDRMEADGHLTQPRWNTAKAWLVAAGVLEYKNRATAVWKTEDRRVVKALLVQYAARIHPTIDGA